MSMQFVDSVVILNHSFIVQMQVAYYFEI